jgi:UDP-glucose 4-epimerase
VINFGNDEEVSIEGLAKKAIAMTGSSSEIRYIPYTEAYGEGFEDMRRRVPSLEKAKRLVGYQPTRTLEDIINDVAEQFREELKTEAAGA